jgi:molecular chaperone GrpE
MMPLEPEEIRDEQEGREAPGETGGPEPELEAERKKAAEYLAMWKRAQADFINYKRRTEAERQEFNSFANATLVQAILPVLDDLERALDHIPQEYADTDWVKGVRLVERKFKTVLEGQGVKPILSLGMQFDPNYHEAFRQEEGPEGVVLGELQKGYMLNDKLLRPARVVVGKAPEAETKEEEQNG